MPTVLTRCSLPTSLRKLALQMVVVSEPRLVAQLLHNGDLAKPTEPVMVHFRQVRH